MRASPDITQSTFVCVSRSFSLSSSTSPLTCTLLFSYSKAGASKKKHASASVTCLQGAKYSIGTKPVVQNICKRLRQREREHKYILCLGRSNQTLGHACHLGCGSCRLNWLTCWRGRHQLALASHLLWYKSEHSKWSTKCMCARSKFAQNPIFNWETLCVCLFTSISSSKQKGRQFHLCK